MSRIGVSGPTLSRCLRREHSACPAMNLSRTSRNRTDALTSANALLASVSNSMANTDGSSPGKPSQTVGTRQSPRRAIMLRQCPHKSAWQHPLGFWHQQGYSESVPLKMGHQLSYPFEHTIGSNTCRYWSQLDLPVYLGTDVDVNPDRLVVWEELGGLLALPYPNSVRNSARSFCSRATASTSSTSGDRMSSYGRPDWATVGYSSSGGHPTWASAPSLPEEILFGSSGPKRARLRGVPRRAPSLLTPRSTTDLVSNRSPARRLRLIGCESVGWYELWSHQPTLFRLVLLSWV